MFTVKKERITCKGVSKQSCFSDEFQGSITGAFSALTEDVTPSFILLAVQNTKVVCYVYELINDQVEVSKTEFSKRESPEGPLSSVSPLLMQSLLS